jgi:hypothetical protein
MVPTTGRRIGIDRDQRRSIWMLESRPKKSGIRLFGTDINELGRPVVAAASIAELWIEAARVSSQTELRFIAGARGERPDNILTGDNPGQPVIAIGHGNAPDAMFDHQLQYPRQPGVWADINEFADHDIGHGPVHQLGVARNHLVGRKGKALQQIELGYDTDRLAVLFDRIGVEIVALEHGAEFAYREFTRHRFDDARHVAGNDFLEEFIQGAGPIDVVAAQTANATSARNAKIA